MPTTHYPKYFWHPTIHQEWAGESLHYYRLTFLPKLDKDAILTALREALEKRGITSFSWNETYGSIDIVVRLWLRPEHRPEVFATELRQALTDERITCRFSDSFHVEKIFHHWRWPKVSLPPLDRELIEDVNAGRNTPATRRALRDHLIKAYSGRDGWIHFYIGIPSHAGDDIKKEIPPRILRRYRGHKKIKHLAIYLSAGGGPYDIIAEGDVANKDYDEIARVSDFLNELGCLHGVKTETHLVTGPSKRSFYITDVLSIPRVPRDRIEPRPYRDYARAEEDETLEKKATTYTDLKRFLATGQKHRDDAYLLEGPLKTIVGMLHNRGGEIVIGLLEDRKLPKEAASRLANHEKIGDCYVTGIEEEATYKNWDDYEQQLRNTIDALITPRLAGTGLLQISRVPAGRVSLALVTVYPAEPAEWFEIGGKVYVRDGNRTMPVPTRDLPRLHERRKVRAMESSASRNKKGR